MPDAVTMTAPVELPRIWFDVEDLFHFASGNARPTGIQRVCFEIYGAVMADPALACRVGFLRHAVDERGFVEANWSTLETMFRRMTEQPSEPGRPRSDPVAPALRAVDADEQERGLSSEPLRGAPPQRPVGMRIIRRALDNVPERIRRPSILFAVMQAQAAAALAVTAGLTAASCARRGGIGLRRLRPVRAMLRPVLSVLPAGAIEPAPVEKAPRRLAEIARRGDVLVVLGSPWFELDYSELAAFARGRLGMRLAVLLYDVIPIRRPEWVDRGICRVFRHWYSSVLPLADTVFAISQATADDLVAWCKRDNVTLPAVVHALPLGTGFGTTPARTDAAVSLPGTLAAALQGRPYVLFVSTIEARKNHMLLFRVWRRLLEEMGPDRVPDLVFAGKVGWMVADLMAQIENSRNLNGRLHVIEGLDDAALREVYAGCLFTVFPSFYEGWGLPVSESLAMGKPCVSSSATSLPEAGGSLARYFDPADLNDATRVIRDTIEDKAGLAEWQAEVRRSFRPVRWDRAALAILETIDRRA